MSNNSCLYQGYKVPPPEVAEGIKQLAKKFNSLRITTFRYIQEQQEGHKVKVDDFRIFVCDPEHLLVHQDHRELRRAKSTLDICTILSQKQYLNWQHYDLLEDIIIEYGNSPLKNMLEEYLEDIKSFEGSTKLNDVKNIIFTPHGPNSYLMKVPVPEEIENPTMETVREVKNGLKKMNGFSYPLHHIGKNSPLGIYFIIPRLFLPPTFMTEPSISVTEPADEIEGCIVIRLSNKFVKQLLNLPTSPKKPAKYATPLQSQPSEEIHMRHVSAEEVSR